MPAGIVPYPFGDCRVCKDRATGVHYGVATCEGCKGFFKRSITKAHKYKCFFGGQCLLNPQNRNRCKSCRWKQCLSLGMSVEAVKMGRIPKVDKERALEVHRRLNNGEDPAPMPFGPKRRRHLSRTSDSELSEEHLNVTGESLDPEECQGQDHYQSEAQGRGQAKEQAHGQSHSQACVKGGDSTVPQVMEIQSESNDEPSEGPTSSDAQISQRSQPIDDLLTVPKLSQAGIVPSSPPLPVRPYSRGPFSPSVIKELINKVIESGHGKELQNTLVNKFREKIGNMLPGKERQEMVRNDSSPMPGSTASFHPCNAGTVNGDSSNISLKRPNDSAFGPNSGYEGPPIKQECKQFDPDDPDYPQDSANHLIDVLNSTHRPLGNNGFNSDMFCQPITAEFENPAYYSTNHRHDPAPDQATASHRLPYMQGTDSMYHPQSSDSQFHNNISLHEHHVNHGQGHSLSQKQGHGLSQNQGHGLNQSQGCGLSHGQGHGLSQIQGQGHIPLQNGFQNERQGHMEPANPRNRFEGMAKIQKAISKMPFEWNEFDQYLQQDEKLHEDNGRGHKEMPEVDHSANWKETALSSRSEIPPSDIWKKAASNSRSDVSQSANLKAVSLDSNPENTDSSNWNKTASVSENGICQSPKLSKQDMEDLLIRVKSAGCDFLVHTKEKVVLLQEELGGNYPVHSLNKLRKATKKQVQFVWDQLMLSIPTNNKLVLGLCQNIPGFTDLDSKDQSVLMEEGYFDIWLMQSSALFYKGDSYLRLSCKARYSRWWMMHFLPRKLVDKLFDFCEKFQSCNLTDTEINIACAIQLTNPDRNGITNSTAVKELHDKYLDLFVYSLEKIHGDAHGRILINVFQILPMLAMINKEQAEVIYKFKVDRPPEGCLLGCDSSGDEEPSETIAT